MFGCDNCGEFKMEYDYHEKKYHCGNCDYEVKVRPTELRCPSCGTRYNEYTWFDPGGCSTCNKSFTD